MSTICRDMRLVGVHMADYGPSACGWEGRHHLSSMNFSYLAMDLGGITLPIVVHAKSEVAQLTKDLSSDYRAE